MPIWREQIRTKRKQLNITQTTLARRIGITVRHVQRLENGTRSPSSSLQMQIDYVLAHWGEDPELTLNFDYVRIRFPTHDVETLIEKVLNLKMDFMLFNDWGLYGYSTSYVFSNIQVMASTPTEKIGTLLELKGQGCREFEGVLLANDETWFDFFRRCLELKAVFKRIDLAINDHAGLLSIPELITKCEKNECISVMRRFEGLKSGALTDEQAEDHGASLYVGSMKSDIYFCIYEKEAEQQHKFGTDYQTVGIKNRFEIRLKNDRAKIAIEDLLAYRDVERTAFGIITRYIRFVNRGKNKDRAKWPLNPIWTVFCGKGRQPLRLTLDPEPFDLRRTRAWIKKQVAPTLKVLLNIDGYNGNNSTMAIIKNTELKQKHQTILEQQTLGISEVGGDYFENDQGTE